MKTAKMTAKTGRYWCKYSWNCCWNCTMDKPATATPAHATGILVMNLLTDWKELFNCSLYWPTMVTADWERDCGLRA